MASTAPYFDLRLTPNRSLDRRHFRWLIAGFGVIALLAGLRFVAIGAWPILPFLLLDVVLLWWAFRVSYRTGRAFEEVRLDDSALTVRKVTHTGVERRVELEPFWARVQLERQNADENRLWLASRGRRIAVGYFLSPREREEIYDVIADGLDRYRRGGTPS